MIANMVSGIIVQQLMQFSYYTLPFRKSVQRTRNSGVEPLSPILFILFINDISSTIDYNCLAQDDLDLLSRYLILFADDIVLFTTDPAASLQAQIDNMYRYSLNWGVKLNVAKIKICVLEKRKQVHREEFYISNENVEYVDQFTYLDIIFSHAGNMSLAVNVLQEQALHAYYNRLSLFERVHLDIKTKVSLFDQMFASALNGLHITLLCMENWVAFHSHC